MRKFLLALGILALLCSPAMAGKNAGGGLIVHTNDANNYTGIGLCARFETVDNPGSCDNAGVQSNKAGDVPALVWVLAAFPNGSNPGVVVILFGLNHNLPVGLGYFDRWGFCGPAGSLEIPDAGWPETGGNSVAFGAPIVGDTLFPFYFLNVYGDPGSFLGTGVNPTVNYAAFIDDSNPPVQDDIHCFGRMAWGTPGDNNCECLNLPPVTEACCFENGDCQDLTVNDCAALGGTSQGAGSVCTPGLCQPTTEACCFENGDCRDLTVNDCAAQGGTSQGAGSVCTPELCLPPPTEACCFADFHCEDLTVDDCTAQGGTSQGAGSVCTPGLCEPPPVTGACCIAGNCSEITEQECLDQNGTYQGDGTLCSETECPPVATETTTWGAIKANYR